jgi:hypothetical protein
VVQGGLISCRYTCILTPDPTHLRNKSADIHLTVVQKERTAVLVDQSSKRARAAGRVGSSRVLFSHRDRVHPRNATSQARIDAPAYTGVATSPAFYDRLVMS